MISFYIMFVVSFVAVGQIALHVTSGDKQEAGMTSGTECNGVMTPVHCSTIYHKMYTAVWTSLVWRVEATVL